jgi:hypothetical protein
MRRYGKSKRKGSQAMSKQRRFPRQAATNPAQIKATGTVGPLRVPISVETGDGKSEMVMVAREDLASLQGKRRNIALAIPATTEDGTPMTLTVGK